MISFDGTRNKHGCTSNYGVGVDVCFAWVQMQIHTIWGAQQIPGVFTTVPLKKKWAAQDPWAWIWLTTFFRSCKRAWTYLKKNVRSKSSQRMQHGSTQNTNECLNWLIWSKCPKTVCVGTQGVHTVVASAMSQFNQICAQLSQVMRRLDVTPSTAGKYRCCISSATIDVVLLLSVQMSSIVFFWQ